MGSLALLQVSWFLIWGEGRPRGVAYVVCPLPLVVLSAGNVCSTLLLFPTPVFAPSSSEVAVGDFGLFVACCP